MIKMIVQDTYTKRDINGNVYHAITIINLENRESFTTSSPNLSNVTSILQKAGFDYSQIYTIETCTGSARHSSLPKSIYLDPCRYTEEWKKQLIGINCL